MDDIARTDDLECPKCGGKHFHKRGFQLYATAPNKRQKYQCTNPLCGHTFVPTPSDATTMADDESSGGVTDETG